LQGIVDGDQKMLVGLREQVSRLKFGGGS